MKALCADKTSDVSAPLSEAELSVGTRSRRGPQWVSFRAALPRMCATFSTCCWANVQSPASIASRTAGKYASS